MRGFNWIIIVCLLAAPMEASLVDLSTLTNLNDANDDSAAFESAIVMAGEGGGLLIPQGRALLSKSVRIAHAHFALLGNGSSGSRVVFSEGTGLEMTAASSARYTIRNLGFSVASGVSTTLVRLHATKGKAHQCTLRDVSITAEHGNWHTALVCEGFDCVTVNELTILGRREPNLSTTGIRFVDTGHQVLLTNCRLEELTQGLVFADTFAAMQLIELALFSVDRGVVLASGAGPGTLQLNESSFQQCSRPISVEAATTLAVVNCSFTQQVDQATETPDLYLDNDAIAGTLTGNEFGQGIYCKTVDHLGIAGNVFTGGFRYQPEVQAANVVVLKKSAVLLEGNCFSQGENAIKILQETGSAKTGITVPLTPTSR